MGRVKDLFGDNNDLILGFNKFLPEHLHDAWCDLDRSRGARPRKRVKKSAESAVTVQVLKKVKGRRLYPRTSLTRKL